MHPENQVPVVFKFDLRRSSLFINVCKICENSCFLWCLAVNDRILTNGYLMLFIKAQDFVLQQKQSPTRNRFHSSRFRRQ